MGQKNLSRWLKIIVIGMGICGLIIFAFIIPQYCLSLKAEYPGFSDAFWPWLIFIWISGIPCFAVLYFAWRIFTNIGRDLSFTEENAGFLRTISIIAAADTVFFFAGNIALLLMDMSHPLVAMISFIIVFAGVAIAVIAAALSHLVKKAAELQQQSDLTI